MIPKSGLRQLQLPSSMISLATLKRKDQNTHSHSKPELAFSVFTRFVAWKNAQNSIALKMALNRHFCTDYQVNCAKADQIGQEFRTLLTKFVEQVKIVEVTNAQKRSPTPAPGNALGGELVHSYEPMRPYFSEAAKIPETDKFVLRFSLRDNSIKNPPVLSLEMEKESQGFYAIKKISILPTSPVENPMIYTMQGLTLLKNAAILERTTGLENLDRVVLSYGKSDAQILAIERPTIEIMPGDSLSLHFAHFEKLTSYPQILCTDLAAFRSVFFTWTTETLLEKLEHSFPPSGNTTDKAQSDLCNWYESRINLTRPRRSSLLTELPPEDRPRALKIINAWVKNFSK